MKRKNPNRKTNAVQDVAPQIPTDIAEMQSRENIMRTLATARSEVPTPKTQIKKKGDGTDYVEEAWMRHMLDKHFPNWSWVHAGDNPVQFLGGEWVTVSGTLTINDNGVQRYFFSPGSARVQFKKGQPHTPENVVNIDYNVASANSNALKRAINRLCHIADDVYRKQILDLGDEEHAIFRELFDDLRDSNKDKVDELNKLQNNLNTKIKAGSINITNYELAINEIKNRYEKESK